jgi:ATP-dependent helicase HrpA
VGSIPRRIDVERDQGVVQGYPALVDETTTVGLRVLATADDQRRAMPHGVRRLLLLDLPSPVRAVVRRLDSSVKLALSHNPYPSVPALLDDAVAAAVDGLVRRSGGVPWDEAAYTTLRQSVRAHLEDATLDVVTVVGEILVAAHEVTLRTAALPESSLAREDLEVQMQGLVHPGFVSATGPDRLPHVRRYVRGMRRRLDVRASEPAKDERRMLEVHEVEDEYFAALDRLPAGRRLDPDVTDVRWMLEELRVSVFAQQLGTTGPVSAARVRRALSRL